MKKHLRQPEPSLQAAALPANDNTSTLIVHLLETMPLADRAALFGDQIARMAEATLDAILARQPVAVLRRVLVRHGNGGRLRLRALDERDARYRALAARLPAQRTTYATTVAIKRVLERYRDGSWQLDKGRAVPNDPTRRLMHEILTLDKGKVRDRATIKRALAGTRSKLVQ